MANHPDAATTPGLVLFRFDAPLIFANARTFSEQVTELAEGPDVRWIVIAAEPITDVDTTAADMLEELDEWLNARGISLVFAEMKDPVRSKVTRYELTRTIDPTHFYPTIKAAVTAFNSLDADATGSRGGHRDRVSRSLGRELPAGLRVLGAVLVRYLGP